MIQRIQSLYLLIISVLQLLVYFKGFTPYLQSKLLNAQQWSILSWLIIGLVWSVLLLYKYRPLQWKLILVGLILMLSKIGMGLYGIRLEKQWDLHDMGLVFDLFSIALLIVSYRAVRKDESLVRSIDRIR